MCGLKQQRPFTLRCANTWTGLWRRLHCWLGSTVILWAIVGGTSFLLRFLGQGCFHWCVRTTNYVGRGRRCQWRTFRIANTHTHLVHTRPSALIAYIPYVYLAMLGPAVLSGRRGNNKDTATSNRAAYSLSDASRAVEQGRLAV